MCTSGNPVKAEEALKFGIVDRIIEGDLLAGAVAFAREVAAKPAPKNARTQRKAWQRCGQRADFVRRARNCSRRNSAACWRPSPPSMPWKQPQNCRSTEGCQVEQKLFIECLFSDQSKALIHVFFSEREVAKIPDVPKETSAHSRKVRRRGRRRHHGRRDRHGPRQCRHSRAAERGGPGRARSRAGYHPARITRIPSSAAVSLAGLPTSD